MESELLNKTKGYEFIQEDVNTMGYYVYADYVNEVFNLVIGDKIIKNYSDIYKKIKEKNIDTLTLDEIVAYFTFIRRGERFCDGHIASFLDNGIFFKLYERYLYLK